MSNNRTGISIDSLAEIIANRILSIRKIYAERGEQPPAGEVARQFRMICERTALRSGSVTTQQIELLATELVPQAIARLQEPERIAA
jgi:hypothetical protein